MSELGHRYALALLTLGAVAACQPPPWGSGAVELPETSARVIGGIERRVDGDGLERAGERLMAATAELRDRGLDLDLDEGPVTFDAATLPLTRLAFVAAERGLILQASVPALEVPWRAREDDTCAGTLALGPGAFDLGLDFATDKLGRIHLVPDERARWSGPLRVDEGPPGTGPCAQIDEALLADLLMRRLPSLFNAAFGNRITTSLGLRIAAPLGDPGLPGGAIFRAYLRGRSEAPVTRRDAGVTAHFELALQTDIAPCLAPLAFPVGRDPDDTASRAPSPEGHGLFVPIAALAATAEALSLHGALCGRLEGVGPLDLPTLLNLAPSWQERIGAQPVQTIELAWHPHGPAHVTAGPDDTLRWQQPRTDFDVWARWVGARWRLGTISAALDVGLTLELQPDGHLVSWISDIAVAGVLTTPGLLAPLPAAEAEALLAHATRALLNGRRLLGLPAELTPGETEPVEVDALLGIVRIPTQ